MVEPVDRGPPASVAAIVLAAGFSSRMGAFKPLLPFGEETLIAHVVANLRAAGLSRIHVVTGFQAEALAPTLERLGVARVHNPDYPKGMFSSVQAGVASLASDVGAFLLAPVDVPLVRPATVMRVLRAAEMRDSAIIYPAFRGERGHPPLIRRTLIAEILAGDGEGGLRTLLARHEEAASEIPVFDWGCLIDMDRRGDYRLLSAALGPHRLPDLDECEAMFDVAATPEVTRRHGRAVAALTGLLARRLRAAGQQIDPDLARAAALVHDIAKGARRHADAGAAMMREFGFPELVVPVARHMDLDFDGRLDESAIVYLADKLIEGETRVLLERRFGPALKRFAGDRSALAGVRRRLDSARAIAAALQTQIGSLGGPDQIEAAISAGGGEWPAAIAV